MAQEFGAGATEASMIITAGTLAVAATAPFTGALSDVLGRKRVIVAAMALLMVPVVMVAFAPTLQWLIFWRFVHGLLLPPIFAVTIAYVGDEWPAHEANGVIGTYVAASALAGFLGRFIPGLLTDYVGWRGGFLALSLISLTCLIVVATLLTHEQHFVRTANFAASTRQMLAHLRNPKLLATYAIGFGVLFNFIATFTYISFHLAAPPFNRSPAFLGSIFFVYLIGSAFALWSGRAIAWLGRRNFMFCALGGWAAGMVFTLIPSIPAIVVGLLIISTCGILAQACSTSFVAVTAQGGTSSAVGLYVTCFYVGGTFGGWLAGLAYEAHGWAGSAALVMAMLAIQALIVATTWNNDARTR